MALYGFIDDLERTLFRRLLTASGVGGKLALAMMSAYRADRLATALGNIATDMPMLSIGEISL